MWQNQPVLGQHWWDGDRLEQSGDLGTRPTPSGARGLREMGPAAGRKPAHRQAPTETALITEAEKGQRAKRASPCPLPHTPNLLPRACPSLAYLRARCPRQYLCRVKVAPFNLRYFTFCSQPRTVFWIMMVAARNLSARSFSR